ncbi:MAG: ATP-dependent RecD-like DNA helicase, partial [Anaerolineales bacterium]|nr:ATP-dependent RecD-like DNA helicase [Anaerolineales bacterium]
TVERITYTNPENGYSVIRLRLDTGKKLGADRAGLITITGYLPEVSCGEHLHLRGRWSTHPRHGRQFQADSCEQSAPATLEGMRRYLGSGLIKGIGPQLAARIVKHLGKDTLEVIEKEPQRLTEVPDIGPKRASLIASAWEEQRQVKEIMLFLHGHAISTNLAVKIYKQYGERSLEVVRSDPYQLAADIHGVGFKTADKIAQSLGLPHDHPARIEAGLVYAINQMSDDGHVYSPQGKLCERAEELLEVPAAQVKPAIERLVDTQRLRREILPIPINTGTGELPQPERQAGGSLLKTTAESSPAYGQAALYLPAMYASERGVADRLRTLAYTIPTRLSDLPQMFVTLEAGLSAEQRKAIQTALRHPVSVLTGGPGTGKTTAIQALIAALESGGKKYALASPTGRAAKRLSQATGRPASTIHRMLGFKPGEGFKHNQERPLPVDLLVVDEVSMLDIILANHLFKALRPGTHLLLVGDVDQLPSVGAGDVLRDVIASELAPVTRLTQIFRQAAGSHIITNAHRINQGKLPLFPKDSHDFFLFPADGADEAAYWVEEVVCRRIQARFGLDPHEDIQVLAPMHRTPAGVDALNLRLQAALNPPSPKKPEKSLFGHTFRSGDKVMQIQNDYLKEVFNGDIGRLVEIDSIEQTLTVDFEGRRVSYEWSEADQIVPAYAVSVHKSQGSEFPAVVVPLVTAHYMMLQRNLIYTAITRARQLCVLVGSKRAISIAVFTDKVSQRFSALDWRLRGA